MQVDMIYWELTNELPGAMWAGFLECRALPSSCHSTPLAAFIISPADFSLRTFSTTKHRAYLHLIHSYSGVDEIMIAEGGSGLKNERGRGEGVERRRGRIGER